MPGASFPVEHRVPAMVLRAPHLPPGTSLSDNLIKPKVTYTLSATLTAFSFLPRCSTDSANCFLGPSLQGLVSGQSPSSPFLPSPVSAFPSPHPTSCPPVQKVSAATSLFCAPRPPDLGDGKGGNRSLRGKRDLQVPDWTDSGWRPPSSSCCRRCWRRCPRCCWRCCWWSFSVSSVWSSVAWRVLLQ